MATSRDYWRRREQETLKKNLKSEAEYAKELNRIYSDAMDNIKKEIDAFYGRYAGKEGITIAEAKKRVSKLDIEAYSRKAEKYVREKDFSKQANEEMRLYNLTMKVNRLEMLKAQIGLELVSSFDEMQKFFEQKLTDRTIEEFQRQAGILGESVGDVTLAASSIVGASFHNATFSQRIWANQDLLRSETSKLLQTGMIQGKHPDVMARELRKQIDVSRFNSERLMRTEMARVQTEAQMQSFERYGFGEYEYMACHYGDVCTACKALDGKHFKTKDAMPGENAPPMHPFCHCSTCAWLDEEKYSQWLDSYSDHGLSFREWQERREKKSFVSNLKAYEDLKTKSEAKKYMNDELGIKTINDKGLSVEQLNKINHSLYNIYRDYPELKGIVQRIGTIDNAVAAFVLHNDKGNMSTSLLFNANDLNDIDSIINEAVKAGRWTPKNGLEGILRHEMAHAFEVYKAFETVDIFSNNVNSRLDRYECAMQHSMGLYAERIVRKAFGDLGIDVTVDNIEKYTSGYAAGHFKETGKLNEAFAEIMSDSRKGELYQAISRLLKEY